MNVIKLSIVLFLYVSLSLFGSSATSATSRYKLTGTFIGDDKDSYNGKTIYLLESSDKYSKRIDSCIVVGHSFGFSQDISKLDDIGFVDYDYRRPPLLFVKEPGNIQLELSNITQRVGGTPLNNIYQQFLDSRSVIFKQLIATLSELESLENSGKLSIEKYKEIKKERDELAHALEDLIVLFFEEQPKMTLTRLLIFNNIPYLKSEKSYNILSKLFDGDETKQSEDYKKILAKAMSVEVGGPFKDIYGTDARGDSVALSEIVNSNKLTLVDFWASWCRPCRVSNPKLKEIYETYKPMGLAIVGVTLDKDRDAWLAAVKEDKIEWHQIAGFDPDDYGLLGIPAFALIDNKGIIIMRDSGSNKLLLEMTIRDLLGE